jgi:hypothetical protein
LRSGYHGSPQPVPGAGDSRRPQFFRRGVGT